MNISTFLITNLVNGLIGILLLLFGFFIFNIITPKWNFTDVFREKGISGGAIVVAAFLLGLSIIIAATGF